MGFKHTTSGDISTGGSWLAEPGTYHLCITHVEENPTKKDGTLIPNAAFRVDLEALAGTVEGQKGKTIDLILFYPKSDSKDGGAFAKKKIERLFLSTCLATQEQLTTPGVELDIDIADMKGRQIVAKFEEEETDRGKKMLQLAFADIFHVDDPAVAGIPKDAGFLKLIPAALRWVGAPQATNGAAAATPKARSRSKATPVAATPAAAVPATSFDDV